MRPIQSKGPDGHADRHPGTGARTGAIVTSSVLVPAALVRWSVRVHRPSPWQQTPPPPPAPPQQPAPWPQQPAPPGYVVGPYPHPGRTPGHGAAVASLVLGVVGGIFGLVCTVYAFGVTFPGLRLGFLMLLALTLLAFALAATGTGLGIVALVRLRRVGSRPGRRTTRSMAITGVSVSGAVLVLAIGVLAIVAPVAFFATVAG